ncbi:metallothionein-like [Saccostrea cucullata]|uniref:metallothionein-like n=1 Tax=Saccostrea cuccullata TaxID=36930 RepID=UPI002ED500AA
MSDPCNCIETGKCECADSCPSSGCKCGSTCKCGPSCKCPGCKLKCNCSGTCGCGKGCTGPENCKCTDSSCVCKK